MSKFCEVIDNIVGYSEKDTTNRKIEALIAQVKYLTKVVEVMNQDYILKKHASANAGAKKKVKGDTLPT